MTIDLPASMRPTTFEKVIGQDHPVRILSGLARARVGRNILLHGAVGSGKTTLARVYGRALNCMALASDGSPCGECDQCRSGIGFFEYDVPGEGGDLAKVMQWVTARLQTTGAFRFRVLFMDEAHAIQGDAADALLKTIENSERGSVFILATTEPGRIRPALRSRLLDLQIKPLSFAASLQLLRSAADENGLTCEAEALRVIAGAKGGYPRNLLVGLEHLLHLPLISLADVKDVFDLQHVDRVLDYFDFLANADFQGAVQCIAEWQEDGPDKVKWVQAFLLSVYYNDILQLSVPVQPAIDTLEPERRRSVIGRFASRLGLSGQPQIIAFWRDMLLLWSTPIAEPDDVAALLQFTSFHFAMSDLATGSDHGPSAGVQNLSLSVAASLPARELIPVVAAPLESDVLRREDVRRIINCASFLPQRFYRLFNARIELRFDLLSDHSRGNFEPLQRELMGEFWQAFERLIVAKVSLDRISVVERGDEGLFSIAAVHIPATANLVARQTVVDWVRAWELTHGSVRAVATIDMLDGGGPKRAVRFHWNAVLQLCLGLPAEVLDHDEAGRPAPLADLLKIPKRQRRDARPVLTGNIVGTSASLSDEALTKAAANRMPFLSAFDDRAWSRLFDGWELREFWDRKRIAEDRHEALAIAGDDPAAIKKLYASWPSNPKEHFRSWDVWWSQPSDV